MQQIQKPIQYWFLTAEETLESLKTDKFEGLAQVKAEALLNQYGTNELQAEEKESIWSKIVEQFQDTLVRILLLSAVISFLVSQLGKLNHINHQEETKENEHTIPAWIEPAVIFLILILNACVGIWQDLDAEKAIEALDKLQTTHALVLRGAQWSQIEAKFLVPGDIIQISQGDKVPADARVIELKTINLKVEQPSFTGETEPKSKSAAVPNKTVEHFDNVHKTNILFSSTLVATGSALAVVIATGMNTELGKIKNQVIEAGKTKEESPLKKRLTEFGDTLAKAITVICILCWVINIPNFSDSCYSHWYMGAIYYFKVSVALAVAAIPEGLPAVITTCLALGTRRMAKLNAIIRKLQSVETLGCTTVICSDKTGTLTTNEMCIEHFFVLNGNEEIESFQVESSGYKPIGKIFNLQKFTNKLNFLKFSQCGAICNESKLLYDEEEKRFTRSGLPTEAAIKVLNEKLALYTDFVAKNPYENQPEPYNTHLLSVFKKVATLEFTQSRKSMSVLVFDGSLNQNVMFVKGAPDYMLKKAKYSMEEDGSIVVLDEKTKSAFEAQVKQFAEQGLRTLAICYKADCGELQTYDGPTHKAHALLEDEKQYESLEFEPVLLGVVAMRDPPRPDVKNSIQKCKNAGISVVMITGDIKETANSIASDINIISKSQFAERSMTGAQFKQLTPEQQIQHLSKAIENSSGLVFARAEPAHKQDLVKVFSKLNQIVAMTGDGVNDASALKEAHIGIAMGIAGTEVAKQASTVVLADDNFATIVAAVEEGRAIYANMKSFIRYMISSNIGEVVSIFITSLLGIPDGFNSVQLLWVNLVTDGPPATALSFNPPEPGIMQKPPRKHDEPLISGWVFFRYLIIGAYVGISTVAIFAYWYLYYDWSGDNFNQLRNWSECKDWGDQFKVNNFANYNFDKNPCSYFEWGKQKASTLSLTVLVLIEMLNALNSLSDEQSLFEVGITQNKYLLYAISVSLSLHCMICYVPFFEGIFNTVPLTLSDWFLVFAFSLPVVLLDEILKFVCRRKSAERQKQHKLKTD